MVEIKAGGLGQPPASEIIKQDFLGGENNMINFDFLFDNHPKIIRKTKKILQKKIIFDAMQLPKNIYRWDNNQLIQLNHM